MSPGLRLLSGTLFPPPAAPPGPACGGDTPTGGAAAAGARTGDRDKNEFVPLDAVIAGDVGTLTAGRDGIRNAAMHWRPFIKTVDPNTAIIPHTLDLNIIVKHIFTIELTLTERRFPAIC